MNTQQNTSRLRRAGAASAALGTAALLVFAAPVAAIAHDGANTEPIAEADYYTVMTGNTHTLSVLGNDYDSDGDGHSITDSTTADHGVVAPSGVGQYEYTPDAGFLGVDHFTYTLTDEHGASDVGDVWITVVDGGPVLPTPIAAADFYDTLPGQTLVVDAAAGVLANDSLLPADGFAISLQIAPTHGTLSLNVTNGAFSYAPDAGYTGYDTFHYQIAAVNPSIPNSQLAAVEIHIATPQLPGPTAAGESYTVEKDTYFSLAAPGVLANDSSGTGSPIVSDNSAYPQHGTGGISLDGSLWYQPEPGFVGTDTMWYIVKQYDANGKLEGWSPTMTVTFNVVEPDAGPGPVENLAPAAQDDHYQVGAGNMIVVSAPGPLDNDSDPEGDPIKLYLLTDAAHGTFAYLADGSFSYTPEAGFVGIDSVSYVAEELTGDEKQSAPATIFFEVLGGIQLDDPIDPTEPADQGQLPTESTESPSTPTALAQTGSDGSSWVVLASFLVIYAGGMALRFARRHPIADTDAA
jgi:hypothetical protein